MSPWSCCHAAKPPHERLCLLHAPVPPRREGGVPVGHLLPEKLPCLQACQWGWQWCYGSRGVLEGCKRLHGQHFHCCTRGCCDLWEVCLSRSTVVGLWGVAGLCDSVQGGVSMCVHVFVPIHMHVYTLLCTYMYVYTLYRYCPHTYIWIYVCIIWI